MSSSSPDSMENTFRLTARFLRAQGKLGWHCSQNHSPSGTFCNKHNNELKLVQFAHTKNHHVSIHLPSASACNRTYADQHCSRHTAASSRACRDDGTPGTRRSTSIGSTRSSPPAGCSVKIPAHDWWRSSATPATSTALADPPPWPPESLRRLSASPKRRMAAARTADRWPGTPAAESARCGRLVRWQWLCRCRCPCRREWRSVAGSGRRSLRFR